MQAPRDSTHSIGFIACIGYVVLSASYAVVLALGLLSLRSPADPIRDPYFTMLEVLILVMCPFIVTIFAIIHHRASSANRPYSLVALIFSGLLVGVTACVHFIVLTLSRHPAMVDMPTADLMFAFKWPSVVYALDILAWDVFFAISVLFGACNRKR